MPVPSPRRSKLRPTRPTPPLVSFSSGTFSRNYPQPRVGDRQSCARARQLVKLSGYYIQHKLLLKIKGMIFGRNGTVISLRKDGHVFSSGVFRSFGSSLQIITVRRVNQSVWSILYLVYKLVTDSVVVTCKLPMEFWIFCEIDVCNVEKIPIFSSRCILYYRNDQKIFYLFVDLGFFEKRLRITDQGVDSATDLSESNCFSWSTVRTSFVGFKLTVFKVCQVTAEFQTYVLLEQLSYVTFVRHQIFRMVFEKLSERNVANSSKNRNGFCQFHNVVSFANSMVEVEQ